MFIRCRDLNTIIRLSGVHLAHLPRVHEEEVPDLVNVEPDHVDAALDLLHLHAEQRLGVLVVPADALPVVRVNIVIIIVILRILHLHLEPDLDTR